MIRAGSLLTLLAAIVAHAEQPLPVYPGTSHTRIGKDMLMSGQYYRMAYFLTNDSLDKVGKFFVKQWADEGIPTTIDGNAAEGEVVVSGFYSREGLQRSVVLLKHGKQTLGFTVLKDVWATEPLSRASRIPRMEGTLVAQDLVARDDGGGTQSRSMIWNGNVASAREKFTANLLKEGFKLVRENRVVQDGTVQQVIDFARGAEQLVVTISEIDAQTCAVQQIWVGTDRPDAVPNDDAIREARERYQAGKK